MMTVDEIITVVQAFRDGRVIERSLARAEEWVPDWEPNFNFAKYDFRVAPEPITEELCPCCGKPRKCEPRKPREWWIDLQTATAFDCELAGRPDKRVRVMEVID